MISFTGEGALHSPSHGILRSRASFAAQVYSWFKTACRSVVAGARDRAERRQLRLSEALSLGEKRFVCIVEADGERLLLGGSAGSLVLLTRLPSRTEAEGRKTEHDAEEQCR